ncbi:hypothetical protein GA0115254_1088159 [Streptomyces sp. Ncost-T10-10d]|nr:hypothetical protein GA0115254_1088159 [Streptomyces sp. Ncost-T10-10d]
MTNLAIAANGLRKSYGDKVVLDCVDLAAPEATISSLLGPNGAGKTTAWRTCTTSPAAGLQRSCGVSRTVSCSHGRCRQGCRTRHGIT